VPSILAIPKEGFPKQVLNGGVIRWTSPDLYEKHKAQISFVRHPPNRVIDAHSHTVDEVIYLLDGGMETLGKEYPKGSILFVGANTVYGFKASAEGLRWVFFRPNRPEVDITKTDLRSPEQTVNPAHRSALFSTRQIEQKPWRKVGDELAFSERVVMGKAGDPKVAFYTVGTKNGTKVTARHAQFLYVTEGPLRVDGQVCHSEGVVSVPEGTSYTPVAESGKATYLLVEGAK